MLPALLAAVRVGERGALNLPLGEAAEVLRGAGLAPPLDTIFAAAVADGVAESGRIRAARAKAEAEAGKTF